MGLEQARYRADRAVEDGLRRALGITAEPFQRLGIVAAAGVKPRLVVVVSGRGYSSILSAASYDGDPVFGAEGAAAKAWRTAVWTYAYAELAKVQAGERPLPTVAAFVAELPAIAWPA
ncbi:MAG: hypothetical protein Q8O26_08315 [Phreatobacter sp.]|uniref:hypothetical protein n=1 Tax=Phreatobacter sp. TaxID=1966341 RepID=UPI002736D119|nr:hypothetical protein [Phreatobacter sp.]MDP2801871.1 hypothetical protein [Phreatobacter sp.]